MSDWCLHVFSFVKETIRIINQILPNIFIILSSTLINKIIKVNVYSKPKLKIKSIKYSSQPSLPKYLKIFPKYKLIF